MVKKIVSAPAGSMWAKGPLFAYMLVALFSVLPYLNVLHGEFVIDDVAFYVDNPAFAADPNIARFFVTSVWEHSSLQIKSDPLYRPLFLTVMWINQTLFGSNVVAHHLFNIGLHLAAALLLLQLLRRLLPESGLLPALAGTLIFAAHPVHVQAVAWIGAYGHIMATALLLGAMLCYLRHIGGATGYWLGLSLVLFALALLTLETAVVFPLLITAYEYLRLRRIHLRRVIPFWAVLVLYFVVRKLVLGQAAPLDIGNLSAWGTALAFAVGYVEFLFVPWPQFVYLDMPAGGVVTPTGGVLALLLVAAVAVAVRLQTSGKEVLLFGLCWIVLALTVPVISALNPFPLFALRALYLPSVGVSILVAWMVAVSLREQRTIAWAAIALLLMAAVPATLLANRDWLVNTKVYERILLVTPTANAAIALANLYDKRGDAAAAERVLLRAAEHAQDDPSRVSVYERMGLLYGTRGAVAQSEQYYRKVLELAPKRSSAWVGLGNNAWARGEMQSALDAYLTAAESDPANYEASHNVALAYQRLGDQSRAAEYFQRARNLQQMTAGN